MNQNRYTPGTLSGKITDKRTGNPLRNVEVKVSGQDIIVKTDIRGRFQISGLQPGDCTLGFNVDGSHEVAHETINVQPGINEQVDLQIERKEDISLNEPVVLLPLKLEIRKFESNLDSSIYLAEFEEGQSTDDGRIAKDQYNFKQLANIKPLELTGPEYWIRWYPDEMQILNPVGQITEQEKDEWNKIFQIYEQQKSEGSVYKLHEDEQYGLTTEDLEIYYGIRHGKLDPNKKLKCKSYDDAACVLIQSEKNGIREGLGWQDFENPHIKLAWLEFAQKYGVTRARQIAKYCTSDGNWDFDRQFPLQIDSIYKSEFDDGEFTNSLKESIQDQFKISFSNNVSVEIEEIGKKWKIIDITNSITYSACLVNKGIEIYKISGDGSEAFDLFAEKGMPLPSLPEKINLYTVKDRKITVLEDKIYISRNKVSFGLGNLQNNKWMTDYQEAVRLGMGIKIKDLRKIQQIDEADWLIAVGVNETSDSREVFEEIIRRNNATGQFSIFAQDTPTNNTEGYKTQHKELETEVEEYLAKTRMNVDERPLLDDECAQINNRILDAQRLQQMLMLECSSVSEMNGADLAEMTEATAMAALLWKPCTDIFKKHLSQFIDMDDLEEFFLKNVRARGILPVLRIGENPYGLLPAAALKNYFIKSLERGAFNNFYSQLNRLKNNLFRLSSQSPRIDLSTQENIYETFEAILQTNAVSSRVKVWNANQVGPASLLPDEGRKLLKCGFVKENSKRPNMSVDVIYPETYYLHEFCKEDFDPASFQITANSPLLKRILRYLIHIEYGVDFYPASSTVEGIVIDVVTGNLIANANVRLEGTEYMTSTDQNGKFRMSNIPQGNYTLETQAAGFTTTKRTEINIGIAEHNQINLSLRRSSTKHNTSMQSGLGAIANGESDLYSGEDVSIGLSKNKIKGVITKGDLNEPIEGAVVRLEGTNKSAITDSFGRYHFDNLSDGEYKVSATHGDDSNLTFTAKVDSSKSSVEYISPMHKAMPDDKCDRQKTAAKLLKDINPDKLEILLLETLDLFSYRFDAWFTALANEKLMQFQKQKVKPPATGVFGWLEKPGQLDSTSFKPEYIQAPSMQKANTAAILRNASIHNGKSENNGAFQINLSSEQVRKGLWYFEGLRQGHLAGELLGYRLERLIYEESKKPNSSIKMLDIIDLREKYPLPIQQTIDKDDINTSILTIIDGEAFLAGNTNPEYEHIRNQLNRIKDAAADIALCEVINADDNPDRRGGWLDFLDGDALPPREEFVRTIRSGVVHGTKVFMPIIAPENVIATDSITNPRILADPILANFCNSLMPDFEKKEIVIEMSNKKGTKTRQITFFAEQLKIEPIDLVIGGEEELILRTRSYILSNWKQNDPNDLTIASPYNILGYFPDFDETNEQRNEVAIKIISPNNEQDELNIYTYIRKANYIRTLLHKNQSKTSGATVQPENIPCIQKEQLDFLDKNQSNIILAQRLNQIISRLTSLITDIVSASGTFLKSYMIYKKLRPVLTMLQKSQEQYESEGDYQNSILEIERIVTNLSDTDNHFSELVKNHNIEDVIGDLKREDVTTEEVASATETLKSNLIKIEKLYALHLEESTKTMLSDPRLRLEEIGQFGIDEAYTVFPDNPTVIGAQKIYKILNSMLSSLIAKLILLIQDSPKFISYLQFLKVFCQHAFEINEVLRTHEIREIHEKLSSLIPVTRQHTDILSSLSFHDLNFFDQINSAISQEIKTIGSEFEFDATAKSIDELVSLLQLATDKEKIVILTPYILSKRDENTQNWQIDFSNLNQLNGKGHLEEYQKVRPAIANLFLIYQDTKMFKLYDHKTLILPEDEQTIEEISPEKTGNADFIYLSKDEKFETTYLTFLLLDEWQEGIPSCKENTGIALRYNVPQSESPNACIIATAPIFDAKTQYWNNDLLANTIYEVIELMQIRSISSSDMIGNNEIGNFLPSLLFESESEESLVFPVQDLRYIAIANALSTFALLQTSQLDTS